MGSEPSIAYALRTYHRRHEPNKMAVMLCMEGTCGLLKRPKKYKRLE